MKDTRNVLLVIVSLCLVATWGYHLYDKNRYATSLKEVVPVKDSLAIQSRINDSLRSAYNVLLLQMDSSRNVVITDTISTDVAVNEIDSLRNEISAILAINNITKEDLRRAEEKIRQLQKRLSGSFAVVTQPVTDNRIVNTGSAQSKTETVVKPAAAENTFAVAGISFRAIEQGRDQPTAKADAAGSLSIGCVLQTAAVAADAEVFMVVTDPAGDVVQDDPWQSGMFTTAADDRIAYTRKAKVSAKKGEPGRIAVNLKLPDFDKGAYSVQFYVNGVRVGRSELRLN